MGSEAIWGLKLVSIFIGCVMVLTVLFSGSVILRDLHSDSRLRFFDVKPPNATADVSRLTATVQKDKFLGGLLPSGFDERSCLRRHESLIYHKELRHKPLFQGYETMRLFISNVDLIQYYTIEVSNLSGLVNTEVLQIAITWFGFPIVV
ncbi:hypothetical protein K7X08_000046 [Anisodus acutangulus]|uniref:Fucosyltransferase n=1 Tax=Anisodus acutangulus TaxID=402998 RepID=A0A9Q1RD48_9SOLA|nr:hypothetical protein K7X08_000046 [Anisodus acutangulus]